MLEVQPVVLLTAGEARVELRAAVRSRQVEQDPDGHDYLYDRVEVELQARLDVPAGDIPAGRWFRLAYAYTHCSYDDEDELVLEHAVVDRPAFGVVLERLGSALSPRALLAKVAPVTAEAEIVELLARSPLYWS